jgi:hypothetical protein
MADRQSWRPVLFHCPQTGHKVQGLIAVETSGTRPEDYETVSCIACSGVHFINAKTGMVLGMSRGETH